MNQIADHMIATPVPLWTQRRRLVLAVGLFALSCKPAVSVVPLPPPEPKFPELGCTPDGREQGEKPPNGTKIWCEHMLPSGDWSLHGTLIEWHTTGQRGLETTYAWGVLHGHAQYWYPVGTLREAGHYEQGIQTGVWDSFHPNGLPLSSGTYIAGRQEGVWTYWDANGHREEGAFVRDQRNGPWLSFTADDIPTKERIYRNGRLVSQRGL